MIKQKRTKQMYIIAIVLLFVAFMCRQVDLLLSDKDEYEVLISTIVLTIRNTIHISLMVLWCVSLHNRIINKRVRKHVMIGGMLLLFWILARICKNDFTFSKSETVGRYLWYSYYISMVLIPLIGFYIVNYIDKPRDYRTPLWQKLLLIPAFLLIIGVFTNDLHQWVFSFPEGIEYFEDVYEYEFLYVITLSWMILLGGYFVIMLIKKSRIPESREMQSLPAVIFGLAVIFWIMYCTRLITCDITTVDCAIIVLLIESAIQCNMLPSNNNYIEVLSTSTIAAKILDNDYNKKIVSATAADFSIEQIKAAEKEKLKIGNHLINTRPIVGGYVVWQEDITEINEVLENLQDTKAQLGEEYDLLQAELSVKERRVKADEQNKLYDEIAKEVSSQLKLLSKMLNEAEANESRREELVAKICVIGSYIKRRGNLLLLGERNSFVNSQELEFSLRETLENLKLVGVYTALNSKCEGDIRLKYIISAYDLCEKYIELLINNITAMMVSFTAQQGSIKMVIQIGLESPIEERLIKDISVKYTEVDCEVQDEDIIVTVNIEKVEKEEF